MIPKIAGRVAGNVSRGVVAGTASGIGGSVKAAFQEKTVAAAFLKHVPVAMGVGAIAGGIIGSQVDDNPVEGVAKGVAAGAAGALAIRTGRNFVTRWGNASLPAKAVFLAAAAVGVGTVAHAFTHEDSYAAEDTAVDDGMGSYEAAPGPRDRMNSMNAGGDLVFGLHAKRH